jgi:carboxypeptidase PM20D1
MVILLGMILVAAIFMGVLCLRAWRFRPEVHPAAQAEDIPICKETAVAHLQAMVRCRTVSAWELRREEEFEKFRQLLPECYPKVFETCQVERVDTTGVLIRWRGKSDKSPAVFLAHYDVVPADEDAWEKPPFEAVLEGDVLWGRGTLDMKNQLCGVLEAMEYLISTGFTPKNDIYLALSGEEEIMGPSARSIVELFRQRGIAPAFVLDEGGDIMDGFFPGVSVSCAMVGVGEKGVANLEFVARSQGGHASCPTGENPLPRLCRAMDRIRRHPFPQRSSPALDRMVDTMGRYCDFRTRLLLANRHVLRPWYFRWLQRQSGMIAAASRTTFALTKAQGSNLGNVIPTQATMFANLRLLWGDTTKTVMARLTKIMGDAGIEIVAHIGAEPGPDSELTAGWEELQAAIRDTWPQAVVTPYLMVACTDSRHWRDICPNVYRFSAKAVTGAEKATVHGNNERIPTENTVNAAKFFVRLMGQC